MPESKSTDKLRILTGYTEELTDAIIATGLESINRVIESIEITWESVTICGADSMPCPGLKIVFRDGNVTEKTVRDEKENFAEIT